VGAAAPRRGGPLGDGAGRRLRRPGDDAEHAAADRGRRAHDAGGPGHRHPVPAHELALERAVQVPAVLGDLRCLVDERRAHCHSQLGVCRDRRGGLFLRLQALPLRAGAAPPLGQVPLPARAHRLPRGRGVRPPRRDHGLRRRHQAPAVPGAHADPAGGRLLLRRGAAGALLAHQGERDGARRRRRRAAPRGPRALRGHAQLRGPGPEHHAVALAEAPREPRGAGRPLPRDALVRHPGHQPAGGLRVHHYVRAQVPAHRRGGVLRPVALPADPLPGRRPAHGRASGRRGAHQDAAEAGRQRPGAGRERRGQGPQGHDAPDAGGRGRARGGHRGAPQRRRADQRPDGHRRQHVPALRREEPPGGRLRAAHRGGRGRPGPERQRREPGVGGAAEADAGPGLRPPAGAAAARRHAAARRELPDDLAALGREVQHEHDAEPQALHRERCADCWLTAAHPLP